VKRGVAFSRPLLVAALAGVGAAAAMAALHRHLVGEADERRRDGEQAQAALASAIAGMYDCGDPDLAALRARVARFRGGLGSEDSWARLARQFGARWNAEEGVSDAKAGYSIQPGVFFLASPAPSDWPTILETVGAAESQPGVEIVAIEMKSSGDKERRSLDLVKIAVAIHARLAPNHP
jgi:hypothetical protein